MHAVLRALTPGGARTPFDLADDDAYRRWRDRKFAMAPQRIDDLLVEVRDPCAPTPAELAAIRARCRRSNMALYASPVAAADKEIPRRLGASLGLVSLDANWLADEDGVSSITPGSEGGQRRDFIPYTEKPIRWHTDGYYNPPDRQIRGMILHCVRPALRGGENALLDHEIAYCLLRDQDPEFIRALSAPQAMTIPERCDDGDVARAAQTGPVFSLDAGGALHMRYTARTRSIVWHDDPVTRAAADRLLAALDGDSRVMRVRMEAGMGLVCNNVLHDRAGFSDAPGAAADSRRLLYRARFFERIAGTEGACADGEP